MNTLSRGTSRLVKRMPKLALFLILAATAATAANYYVDPATGKMSNNGTSTAPWSTLEAVFSASKTFAAGDILYLRNGYHGAPQIRGVNSGTVTIQPQPGHVPTLKKVDTYNASNWTISGLDISPANTGTTMTNSDYLFNLRSNCSNFTVQNCNLHSVANGFDAKQWAVADWAKAANGFRCDGTNSILTSNTITTVNYGLVVHETATNSLFMDNVIQNFSKDGIEGLADNCEYDYNLVMNSYLGPADGDANHDDGFQSWTTTTISNVTLRGNMIINWTDPDQPFKGDMQGIGCFDGMYDGWIVENNLVVSNMGHGLSFLGVKNSRIVNNTVVKNHILTGTSDTTPALVVVNHKNGTQSTNNTVRNDLAPSIQLQGTYTADHNISTGTNYSLYFVDYAGLDLHLKTGSPAIDAGSTTLAPPLDCDEYPRTAPYDVGCYEYRPPNVHSGTWSLRAVFTGTPTYTNASQVPTGITTGTTYVGSVWIKGAGSVYLAVRAGSWGANLATVRCNATPVWTQVTTAPFSTGSNTQLTVVLQDSYNVAGTVYLDDVFLGVNGGANKLASPGFEGGGNGWSRSNTTIWQPGQF